MNCSCCQNVNDLDATFDLKGAREDAAAYRKNGLAKRSQKMVASIETKIGTDASMLEIGCGAGALHQDLLRRNVIQHAQGIDASSGYLTAARENAEHFALVEQVSYRQADFALDGEEIASAEIVALDRVICCYPNLEELLGKAATHTTRFLTLSYPIDRWWTRALVGVVNAMLTLTGSGYHPYVHAQNEIDAIVENRGLKRVHFGRHNLWQIAVYERSFVNHQS